MDNSFRDTSAQDQQRSLPQSVLRRFRWPLLIIGAIVMAFMAWKVLPWLSAQSSVRLASLQLASVERGAMQSDVSGYGQVVAARAPLLFAQSNGVVEFKVDAGQTVTEGHVLAVIQSPELQSRYSQEQSALAAQSAETISGFDC